MMKRVPESAGTVVGIWQIVNLEWSDCGHIKIGSVKYPGGDECDLVA